MLESFVSLLHEATNIKNVTLASYISMLIRGVIIYFFGMFLIRFDRTLFSIHTTFNRVLLIVLGSIFANAISHADEFLPSLATVLLITIMNGLMTKISFYIPRIEHLVKGDEPIIVQHGHVQWEIMKKYSITERDLLGELCTQLHTQNISEIEIAKITSDGRIKFIKK